MKLAWDKWGLEFFKSVLRHVGTAGMATLATSIKDGKLSWANLGLGVLVGGIMPSIFTFLQSSPGPEEVTTVTTEVTQTTTKKETP